MIQYDVGTAAEAATAIPPTSARYVQRPQISANGPPRSLLPRPDRLELRRLRLSVEGSTLALRSRFRERFAGRRCGTGRERILPLSNRAERAGQALLEFSKHLLGIGVGAFANLPRAFLGLSQNDLGGRSGLAHDVGLIDELSLGAGGLGYDLLRLLLSVAYHAIFVGRDDFRTPDLLG